MSSTASQAGENDQTNDLKTSNIFQISALVQNGDRFHQNSIFESQKIIQTEQAVPQSNKTKDQIPDENSMNQTESSCTFQGPEQEKNMLKAEKDMN